MKHAVIVGGGISGLLAAYLFAKDERYTVTVVERSDRLGGLLKSFDYGKWGAFDHGAHNILESGITELDELFWSLWPEDEWQVTQTINGQIRALTGLIYQGRVQHNSPFMDLRNHPKWKTFVADFLAHVNQLSSVEITEINQLDAYSYSEQLFGRLITEEIVSPALEHLYGKEARTLNAMVMRLTQFNRLVLFDEKLMEELVFTPILGSRLSYTEQLNLPAQCLHHKRSLYPRKYGIYRVIEAIEERLRDLGVVFEMNAEVDQVEIEQQRFKSMTVNGQSLAVDQVVWSAGYAGLASLLTIPVAVESVDSPPRTVMTNMVLSQPLVAGELSFIYSYDQGSRIFRLDNYMNYCEGAARAGGYPITVESLIYEPFDIDTLQKEINTELLAYGLITESTEILFQRTEVLASGFPLLTQNNVNIVNQAREDVRAKHLQNLTVIGVLSEEGLFFESDVLKDAHLKVKGVINE